MTPDEFAVRLDAAEVRLRRLSLAAEAQAVPIELAQQAIGAHATS